MFKLIFREKIMLQVKFKHYGEVILLENDWQKQIKQWNNFIIALGFLFVFSVSSFLSIEINFLILRKRKRKESEIKEEQRQRAEVQYLATRDHYRRLRQFKLQQIQAIQLLPACKLILQQWKISFIL